MIVKGIFIFFVRCIHHFVFIFLKYRVRCIFLVAIQNLPVPSFSLVLGAALPVATASSYEGGP